MGGPLKPVADHGLQGSIDDHKRIAFQQEHPEWHFQAIGFGVYEATRPDLGAGSVHLQGDSLGEVVAKAEAYVLGSGGDTVPPRGGGVLLPKRFPLLTGHGRRGDRRGEESCL
jgi:hypothetical protein